MSRNNAFCLVIDANIARSAGPEDAVFPTSKKCRDFLLAVETHGFNIVSTSELREEWNRHQSGFFLSWRARMMGQKRIEVLNDGPNAALRLKLGICATNEGEREAMLKDCHLLEAALRSDRRIASCETRVRRHFCRACPRVGEIRSIIWVNPDDDDERVLVWLEDGAPEESQRRLENYL